jgi:transposase
MFESGKTVVSVVGIDIGKNSFHVVGLDWREAIVLRQRWSRGQVEARFANLPPCLVGMEACVGAGLADDWRRLDQRIEGLSREIEAIARQDVGCERLMSVPGIGPIIASATVAAIGTGDTFVKGRDFAAWLGLVPKQISTGDRTILGSISRRGNRYLRVLFVQAAWVVRIRPRNWERYGLKSWLEAASKRLHHNVLAIALANKLARIAWSVLARGRGFEVSRLDHAIA